MVAAGLIERLVHHAMITLKGKSYRLRERGLEVTLTSDAAGALSTPESGALFDAS
jgi:hypothetical protein